jgi:hypothetical protein
MLADSSAPKPACSQQASRRLARWLARPSSFPDVMLAGAQTAADRFPAGR